MIRKMPHSGSGDGAAILIAATSSPGIEIHKAPDLGAVDEFWGWAFNSAKKTKELTLEFGEGDAVTYTIPPRGVHIVAPGIRLGAGVVVTAHAEKKNVISFLGCVNRMPETELPKVAWLVRLWRWLT